MRNRTNNRLIHNKLPLLAVLMLFVSVLLRPGFNSYAGEQTASVDHLSGISYSFHSIQQPRAVRLHVLVVDFADENIEPAVVIAETAPDDDTKVGRTDPRRLAEHPRLMAFVNTNPWTPWSPTYPTDVHILGLAATEGTVHSQHREVSIWTDEKGRIHIGEPEDSDIQEGAGGFQKILKEAQIIVEQGGAVHPRTAIGVNKAGNQMCLVVADGRQPEFSEGMTLGELALFMQELGCWNAANMDGGGSSVIGVVNENGEIEILNNPPGPAGYLRPLPILLTIRELQTDENRTECE